MKKPNPCASYGPGFTMLPGTTTCVRIGGSAVGDFSAGRGAAPNLGVK
ncbi:MAG: porin [Rhodoblastus sp.]|nr:porin [Rhodoblastus sp.]